MTGKVRHLLSSQDSTYDLTLKHLNTPHTRDWNGMTAPLSSSFFRSFRAMDHALEALPLLHLLKIT